MPIGPLRILLQSERRVQSMCKPKIFIRYLHYGVCASGAHTLVYIYHINRIRFNAHIFTQVRSIGLNCGLRHTGAGIVNTNGQDGCYSVSCRQRGAGGESRASSEES